MKTIDRCGAVAALLTVTYMLVLVSDAGGQDAKEKNGDQVKTVKARDLTLKVPARWEEEKPSSSLRVTQFKIPAAKDDQEAAELVVFNFGGGGGIENNIRRWIGQFEADGRKVRIASGDATQGKYVCVDISGTYNKPVGPPLAGKTEPAPGSRVLAVILVVEAKGVYFLKLTGLQATVGENFDAFRDSFGAPDIKQEKEYSAEDAKPDGEKN